MKKIVKFFDKVEDQVRGHLSRYPILYTFIGGTAIVLFWRGVWITADQVALAIPPEYAWLDGPFSVASSVFVLLITGLFVSFFVTDRIILSGLKQEKKLVEKAESELREEKDLMTDIAHKMDHIEEGLHDLAHKK